MTRIHIRRERPLDRTRSVLDDDFMELIDAEPGEQHIAAVHSARENVALADSSAVSSSQQPSSLAPHLTFTPDITAEMAFASSLSPNNTTITGPNATYGLIAGVFARAATACDIVNDTSFSASPPNAYRHRFSAGMSPGAGAGSWTLKPSTLGSYARYHEASYLMIGENVDWEGPGTQGQCKPLGYWGMGGGNATIYNEITSNSGSVVNGNRRASTYTIWVKQQDSGGVDFPNRGNMSVGTVTINRRYLYEHEMILGTNTGADANGILRVWLTDLTNLTVQSREYTNVQYRFPANPATGFWVRQYSPIWGGSSGQPLSRNEFVRFDHVYIAWKDRIS